MDIVYNLKKANSMTDVSVSSMNDSDEEDICITSSKRSYLGGPCLTCYKRYQFATIVHENNAKNYCNIGCKERLTDLEASTSYFQSTTDVAQPSKSSADTHQFENEVYICQSARGGGVMLSNYAIGTIN